MANSSYSVLAFTSIGLSASQTVTLGTSDISISLIIAKPQPPNIVITNVNLTPSVINPGTSFNAVVSVQNQGDSTAFGVVLSVTVGAPLTLQGIGSVADLSQLSAKASKDFTLPISVAATAKPGSYTIGYNLNYLDAASNAYATAGSIGVAISGNPLTPNLIISTVSFSPAALSPGSSFQTTVNVVNIGNTPSYNGLLALTIPSPISLVGTSASIPLGTIGANANRSYVFSAYAPTTTKAGSYGVSYTLSYDDKLGASYSGTGSLSMIVISPAAVLLQNVAFLNPILTPGTHTQLQMQVVNGGGDYALNAKVSWAGGSAFLSNYTDFLGAIAPGASTNAAFGLTIPQSTPPAGYDSTLVVSYSDSSGAAHVAMIPFPIRVEPFEVPTLTISNTLLDPPVLTPSTQGTFTIFTTNSGTSAVSNVVVTIINGSQIFSSTVFGLGSVSGGAQVTTVVGVNVSPGISPGVYSLTISAQYTDQTGITHTTTVPVELTIYHSTSIFTTTNLLIVAGIVIIAIGAAAFLFLRRRNAAS